MNVRDENEEYYELTGPERELLVKVERVLHEQAGERVEAAPEDEPWRQLALTVPRARPQFRQQLNDRLVERLSNQSKELSPMQKITTAHPKENFFRRIFRPRHKPLRRALASALLALTLMVGLLATVPPVRTWAQETLDNALSSFGIVRLTKVNVINANDPNSSIQFSEATPGSAPAFPVVTPAALTRAEALAQAGFPPKTPAYLPAGYNEKGFSSGPVSLIGADGKSAGMPGTATWEATNPAHACALTLHQSKSNSGGMSVGTVIIDEKVREVTVGGKRAAFIENRQTGNCAQHLLAWEQDGIRYQLFGDTSLSLDEMIKIAQSLK